MAIYVSIGGSAVDLSTVDVSQMDIGVTLIALGTGNRHTLTPSAAVVDHDAVESVAGQGTLRWLKNAGAASSADSATTAAANTGPTTKTLTAAATLAVKSCVTAKGEVASATDGTKPAIGVTVLGAASAAPAIVVTQGSAAGALAAATPGAIYYLATDGTLTTTPPAAAGNLVQVIGYAESATSLFVQISNRGVVPA